MTHNWIRESGRRSKCKDCGLVAKIRNSSADWAPYTKWSWEGNHWNSRTHPLPSCPPRRS